MTRDGGWRVSWPTLVVRVALLLLAGVAVLASLRIAGQPSPRSATGRYTCAMHPSVTALAPGDCPICGMELSRSGAPSVPGGGQTPGEVVGEPVRQLIFSAAPRGPAWVESPGVLTGQFYNDDLAELGPDDRGSFRRAATPDARVEVRLDGAPPAPWDEATSRIRLRCDPPGAVDLAPGTVGWVTFPVRPRAALLIPAGSVIESPDGPYVLSADTPHEGFVKRRVAIGKVLFRNAFVVSGLRPGDRISVRDTFFLNAERRLFGEGITTTGTTP